MSEEYCETCGEYDWAKNIKQCHICKYDICSNCSLGTNSMCLNEWLIECSNVCSLCNRIGCARCVTTCYQCHNQGDIHPMVCLDCSKLMKNKCLDHSDWHFCEKHFEMECPECGSNKNYSSKYSMF